ncbi:MAG TPA: hypothetical protein VIL16_28475 [Trebonia sp.]
MPAVACFDTAFHATIPAAAATFALPAEWRARWALRRYGLHGLSHAYASRRAAELLGCDPGLAPTSGSSPAIWAPAARWTPRWASPRSTGWSWPPGRDRSTPA